MAEKSFLWTTGVSGDGSAEYTQADASRLAKVLASCFGFEGVAPGYLAELLCEDGGANTVDVNGGGAMVDGKPYDNDAVVSVNIPSAVGGGNTRIDRLVLRADWSARTVRITRIPGTDASSPTVPSITQTSGTTYDILLCQVLVTTGGVVTVTDERVWARGEGVTVAARKGGSATAWATGGTTTYTPAGLALVQVGVTQVVVSSGQGGIAFSFPLTFGGTPVVVCTIKGPAATASRLMVVWTSISASAMQGYITADGGAGTWDATVDVHWVAVGPQ